MLKILTDSNFLLMLGNILSICLFGHMHRTFYTRKPWFERNRWAMFAIYVIVCILWFAANMMEFPPANLAAVIGAYMIPLFICYEVKTLRGTAYFLFYLIGMMVAEIVVGLVTGVYGNEIGFTTRYEVITPQTSLFMNMVEIIVVVALCHFGNKDKDTRFNKITRLFMIMPIFTIVIIVTDLCMMALGRMQDYSPSVFVRMSILFVVVNIAIFIILEKYTALMKKDFALAQREMKLQSDADMLEMAARAMGERLETAERVMQQERTMRHDRRHFEALLASLLQEGKVEEAEKYLEERLAQEPQTAVRYCDNTTVNATLIYYINMALKNHIRVNVSTNVPAVLRVDAMQLSIAISNLIENAIHACGKLAEEERYIRVTAKYKN